MTIGNVERQAGVDVHLDPDECDLLIKLAKDADQATYGDAAPTYVSLCVRLGQRIDAVLKAVPDRVNP
jgi:hypothetical protein